MSEIPVSFATRHYEGVMYQPGVGKTLVNHEVVTALQFPNSLPQYFYHYLQPGEGNALQTIPMPEEKAYRLVHFAEDHYVNGYGEFNCFSFMRWMMGWEAVAPSSLVNYSGYYIDPEETESMKPYVIVPAEDDPRHAMIGTHAPGESLGVAGPENSLIIAKNELLMRAFGGVALMELHSAEPVHAS